MSDKSGIVVVLGKTSVRNTERPFLFDMGRALAIRKLTLVTTNTSGACAEVIAGYTSEGGTPQFLEPGKGLPEDAQEVLVFSDTKFEAALDAKMPNWRDQNWLVFYNPKATSEAAMMTKQILAEAGTPLVDRGDS